MNTRPPLPAPRFALTITALIVACAPALLHAADDPPTENRPKQPIPSSQYSTRDLAGWTVRVNRDLLALHPERARKALELLEAKLQEITRIIPPGPRADLQKVPIWLGIDDGHAPCAEYHPSADWLRDHGYNPEKARCVEIGNAERFLAWSPTQPAMILHELAHAYMHQVLGDHHPDILTAYNRARKAGTYDAVLHKNGRKQTHYALTNPKEFFAELTESYFLENDFFPFNRQELEAVDPASALLIQSLWKTASVQP
jgi:hypothetical protein